MQACFPFAKPYLPIVHFTMQEMLNPSRTEVGCRTIHTLIVESLVILTKPIYTCFISTEMLAKGNTR